MTTTVAKRSPQRSRRAALMIGMLSVAGLLLGGCHYGHRAYHGGPHYAAPHPHSHGGKHDHHGRHYKHKGKHRPWRYRHPGRGYY